MKILVAAKTLDPDRTSEGICTSKFVTALARAGHAVTCLTSDASLEPGLEWRRLAWLGDVPVRHVDAYAAAGAWPRVRGTADRVESRGVAGRLRRKIDAAIVYGTGYSTAAWDEVGRWRVALESLVSERAPDLIFSRSAGAEFHPHFAMVDLRPSMPWVAHYHDPFPLSLYPEPYRRRYPVIAGHQERWHRRILESANALTFPSERLRRWVLKGRFASYADKSFVLPHLGTDLASPDAPPELPLPLRFDPGLFTVAHVGTLLGPRDPGPLIAAFRAFVGGDDEKRALARLVFAGGVNREHAHHAHPQSGSADHDVVFHAGRISYPQSIELIRSATAAVVLEAAAEESPFFPAKLADYLRLAKVVLALSPEESVVRDLLGSQYPLVVRADRIAEIAGALDMVWNAWKNGGLSQLQPTEEACRSIGEAAVNAELRRLYARVRCGRWATVPAPANQPVTESVPT